MSAFMNGGSRPRRGSMPAPAIIPKSMSGGGDAVLEHERGLHERLEGEPLDELLVLGSASPSSFALPSVS